MAIGVEQVKEIQTKDEKKERHDLLWDEPGFHRTLGSVWFQYFPYVYIAITSIYYLVAFLPVFLPPETLGSDTVFKALLGFSLALAQVGITDAIQRFVSEKRISQPQYTIHYIQFFMWFRLFSGTLFITLISVWVFTFLRNFVPLSYSMWFFLWYIALEWPGFWQGYMSTLQGYQQFEKVNYINLGLLVVSFLTSVSMVNLFRYIFGSMPQYGEGFGNLLGVVVGLYLNNIFVFVVSGYVFKPILKTINPEWTMAKTFKPEFPKEIIGECLRFGIQSMSATFVDTGFKMVITYMAILWLPSYGTLFGLFTASMNLVTLCAIDIPITPIVSEAYNNKKKDLTEYYMGHGLKYCGMFASIFGSTILAIAPIFIYMAGPYAEIAPYLPYIVLTRMIFGFGKMLDDCTNGCDKPFFRVFYYLIENSARLGFMALFILGLNLGWVGYLLAEGCGMFLKVIIGWAIFRYRIMNPYMSVMQTLILPAISGLVHFLVIKGLILILFNPMSALIGPHVSIGIFSGICLIITPLFVWWPTYTLLGGWDPVGLDIMEEATEIAGISKVIARQFNKMTKKLARKSPWYNRWRIHFRSAQYELDEIRVMMGREPKRSLHVFDFMPKLPILQHSDINFQAYDISKRGMTYDQLIWMLAEESLRIQEAITISSTSKNKPPKFRIKPDFLNHQPSHEKIEKRAKMIAEQQRPPTNELHWYIAERMLLYKYISENSDKELMEFALK